MFILGLNNNHNATTILLKDGQVVDCISEERFTGIKNYTGIPRKAIRYLLRKNKLSSGEIDLVCLGYQNGGPLLTSSQEKKNLGLGAIPLKFVFFWADKVRVFLWWLATYFPLVRKAEGFLYRLYVRVFSRKSVEQEKKILAKLFRFPLEKIVTFDHHQAHAAAAFFSSPFRQKKVVALTLDAEGDFLCASVNIFDEKGHFKRIAATPIGNSLAQIYKDVTQYLGMKPNEHEYKVMGLAPYAKGPGNDRVFKKIKDWMGFEPKKPLVFKAKFHTGHTYSVLKSQMEGFRFDNIAAAFQRLVEERVTEWVRKAIEITGLKTLVFGGGLFMNVKVNQKIFELKGLTEVFFMPSCGDESTSIGAAYLGYLSLCRKRGIPAKIEPIKDLYWGPVYSNKEIGEFLKTGKYKDKYQIKKLTNPEKTVARLLAKGRIVARFTGRMEWGARALGNRSILADPSNPEIVPVLNEQIKNRDFWMPFAPSILAERAKDYLVNPKNIPAPYMVLAFESTFLARKHLKAAIHPYDFTVRPQIVEKGWNPGYYQIIKEFEKLTGIGAVLNTSFNLHGFPIVLGPKEAMFVFEKSGLEYLLLENYLICKYHD